MHFIKPWMEVAKMAAACAVEISAQVMAILNIRVIVVLQEEPFPHDHDCTMMAWQEIKGIWRELMVAMDRGLFNSFGVLS